jgi:CheY-like chemotaxis protein
MALENTLVVDDSKSARIMLSRMLQKLGLNVSMVESGEEAIEYMNSNPAPDVIFLDHMMPGLNGIDTCAKISASHRCPIFMYTSKEGPEYESEARAAGAAGLLGKPAELSRLQQIIDDLSKSDTQVSEVSDSMAQASSATTHQEETEHMSVERMEHIASQVLDEQFKALVTPITMHSQELKTSLAELQSEVRKLASRQANSSSYVTQPVLDATGKQTNTQIQSLLTKEIHELRELIHNSMELSDQDLDKIRELANRAGASSGSEAGEKAATSAAEAVAAKVSAAQTEVQVKQALAPMMQQVKSAKIVAGISLVVAIGAVIAAILA